MQPPSPLYELASSYWKSASLQAALDLGVFEALAASSSTAQQLSEQLECDPGSLMAFLDALVGLQLLLKNDDTYELSAEYAPYLDPNSKDSLLAAFSFNRDLQGLWDGLATTVRTGTPVLPASPHLGNDPERTKRFVHGMHSRASLMARGLLEVVVPASGSKVLDLAGGPGTFSLRLLERDPSLAITVFDLPPVVQAAQELHEGHPSAPLLTFAGGDYHQDDLPIENDLVLYCGALHQEILEDVPELFSKIRSSLKPEGILIVVDLLLDEDRTTPVYSALFDLNMRLMRPASHVHSVTEVEANLVKAGFSLERTLDVPNTPYRMMEAKLSS